MAKRKSGLLFASLILVSSAFFAACSGKNKEAAAGLTAGAINFPLQVSNTSEVLEDGELTVALVSSDPFEGTLNKVFYSGQPDAEIMGWFDENLLATDGDFMITNDGAATYKLSEDQRTITLTIRDGVKWHDGEPVKASDLLYAYELLGHPDYAGDRYTFTIENIEGMEEYHTGKAKNISGIEVLDDQTIRVTFKTASPSILSGFWSAPVPRHYVGDVTAGELSIQELESSNKIRTKPIGFGPYKVKKIVSGEAVLYERYEDYWRGRPNLQSVVLKIVNDSVVVESLKKGDIDIATVPADQYETLAKLDNIEMLADIDTAYTYMGFKLGKWDAEKKENVMNPNAKLADKRVRQALWHALDNESVGKGLYHGLRFPATTLIIPVFETFHDANNPGRGYDPGRAKQLLDEAGYKDVDGDGFREDPDGKPFVLSFASMAGGDVAEPIAKYYIQNWGDVGIKVELTDGRLHEFNAFYELIKSDDSKVDIFQGAWGTGTDPDPTGLYGRNASFNYSRYTSEKNDELLKAGTSEEAFDIDKRREIYNEWQRLMVEDVPVAPLVYRYVLYGVNKRVVNYTIDPKSDNKYPWVIGVSEDKPVTH